MPPLTIVEENEYNPTLGLSIITHGHMGLRQNNHWRHTHPTGEVWLHSGHSDPMHWRFFLGNMHYCHLALPLEQLNQWLEAGIAADKQRLLERCLQQPDTMLLDVKPLPPALQQHTGDFIVRLKQQALAGAVQQLQLETLSANLIAHCLQIHMGNLQANIAKAVDNAVALIDATPEHNWSINALARQIGTNECYLKKGFRLRMGIGIASYVRQKRMQQALNL